MNGARLKKTMIPKRALRFCRVIIDPMEHTTTRHPSELEQKMRVPYVEISRFNTWASMQITAIKDCPDEMVRLESVLYGIPIVSRLTKADYVQAVEAARAAPNVPESVYKAFQSYKVW